ncbi:MAG: hypothetical protein AABX66_03435 [Nanoarchaeota archaeon]
MATIDDIKQMKDSGASDQDILRALESKGISPQQAYESLSQATIKEAVNSDNSQQSAYSSQELQPSLMTTPSQETVEQPINPQEDYSQYAPDQYYSNAPAYSSGLSTDTISEIADQLITEKMSIMKDNLEKVSDFKNYSEAKLASLDERLQRIEKVIDRLQLSILQKVGESITNIEDIKKELLETQKSFKSLSSQQTSKKTQIENTQISNSREE